MISIKASAIREDVPPAKMVDFLSAQPESLRDIYTDAPFDWDPVSKEIRFTLKSKKWKQSSFAVTYRTVPLRQVRGRN
jgi:hypothetical protein